jgi:hypothetical protein
MTGIKNHDPVNRPGHYTFGKFELQDLEKAAWYLHRRIEKEKTLH